MRWLRRAEIALLVIGISLLGGATVAVARSRAFQASQERAFSALERKAASHPAPLLPLEPVAASAAEAPPDPDAEPPLLGRIEVPRIGLSAIVMEGADDATLAVAVGRIPGTARPGERGNMALAGHRDSFFRALRHIRVDDVIRFRTPGEAWEYRVDSTEVVVPQEVRVLEPTRDEVLTLVTCYPFDFVGRAPGRFIVRASRLRP